MKPTICPTFTLSSEDEFNSYAEILFSFAPRVHIDLADGTLAPTNLVPLDKIWWPANVRADLHVMYKQPMDYIEEMLVMRPALIVVHAEADVDLVEFAKRVRAVGIEAGVALQAETPVEAIQDALEFIDHVQIFSGKLGYHGGQTDLGLLEKVKQLMQLKPQLEIGWDGGINDKNARALAEGGVDVLNVGGFIHHAADPAAAYHSLVEIIS